MSVQFGLWNFRGTQQTPAQIEKVTASLIPYAPDGCRAYSDADVKIIYCAFHTTAESRAEIQPHTSLTSGTTITWDGRLDNGPELTLKLRDSLTPNATDSEIVAVAYEKWGTRCFAKLIGDWALSVWNPTERSLILAKDPIGTRHLYYLIERDQITWSTILDPLVLFAGKTFSLNEEYLAGWFSRHAAPHVTPYVGINSVPASSFVLLQSGKHVVSKYWDFDPRKSVCYRSDAEYEEHFRAVFTEAVRRRLRSEDPVLADLSGGMDSSAIVCIADIAIAAGTARVPRLDTISWYDDGRPSLDERPYITAVERQRGRAGYHIDLGAIRKQEGNGSGLPNATSEFSGCRFAATPFAICPSGEFFNQYAACLTSEKYRVVLAGVGGDEVMGGGVPTPIPELQDLFARGRWTTFCRQLRAWAAKMRKPRSALFCEMLRGFLTPSAPGLTFLKELDLPTWLDPAFVRRNYFVLSGYPSRRKLFGARPSFQNHVATLNVVRREMALFVSRPELLCERRYPYLDRCLLEFMYAIPPDQIVRVGRRRSLMKRALAGIVPFEVLNKRQKPDCSRGSEVVLANCPDSAEHLIAAAIGIVVPVCFFQALQHARDDQTINTHALRRTLALESWLRHLVAHRTLPSSIYISSFAGSAS